mgnify:CR=1 FL=1
MRHRSESLVVAVDRADVADLRTGRGMAGTRRDTR